MNQFCTVQNALISPFLAVQNFAPDSAEFRAALQRAEINESDNESDRINNDSADILDIHQYMRFGNIRFTRKEILTIRLLLSHRKVKEISAVQGCSEASEHKRIQRIKEKLGCPHASSGGVFHALKENGITLACLDTLVSLP